MHKVPARNYMTSEQIDARATRIEREAAVLEAGARKNALIEEAQKLRIYADMKRLRSSNQPAS